MNLWLRLFWLYLTRATRPALKPTEESRIRLRLWLNDHDIYAHVNNGRYLTLMDLGRMDLIWRTGLIKAATRYRWNPIVAAVSIVYKKPLVAGQSIELCTRIIGWDEKWFYIEQRFLRHGTLHAQAYVKGLFVGREGRVPTAQVLTALGHPSASPEVPPEVRSRVAEV
ncbi:MAG: hypothetical protein MOGMAGMI_01707 [Candidatus Omnitrophica bacterium]|nr:hypothetical protein [Candidatus Omnitrophota bacterium]